MNVDLVQESCYTCHIPFWLEAKHQRDLKSQKTLFYCPNGHAQSYTGKSDAQLLQETKARLNTELAENARLVGIVVERGEELEKLKKGKPKKRKYRKKKKEATGNSEKKE